MALLVAPPLAAASRHHKRKPPKRPAPAAASPRTSPAESGDATADDRESPEPAPEPERASAPPEPSRAAPPERGEKSEADRAEAPAEAREPTPKPSLVPKTPHEAPRETKPATAASDGEALDDELALGRREAARLATGRIEVAVSVGIDVGRRQFTYSDPIGDRPRPYLLAAAPLATFGLEVYPLASTLIPVLCDLGFRGRVSRAFAIDSSTTNGAPLENSWTRFSGELRGRVLTRRNAELGIAAGIDGSYFELDSDADVGALVPSARTLSFRIGADGRVVVRGRVSLLAGGAWLATLSRGEIYNRFRRPRVAGLDAELGVAVGVAREVEVRLSGRYTRYFSSFDPQVGDPAVAGGALDQQTQLGVALRYAH